MTLHRVVFFDLDDTLYPPSSGVWQAIGVRINQYIHDRLGLPDDQVAELRDRYFRDYGTTLNGLVHNHAIDPHDYLEYVHDLPLDNRLSPDPDLRAMLGKLSARRVVLTNASRGHVERVLDCLGVRDRIDQVIDILALELVNKPRPEAYQLAMQLAAETDPAACVVLDDSIRNLEVAGGLGMTTVHVGPSRADGRVDYFLTRAADLIQAIPTLQRADARRG